jgi:hypothetical protein
MLVKRFKNGNFNVKLEKDEHLHDGTLVHLIWALYDKDCRLFGEEYCLGNAIGMAADVYCYYTDKVVTIPYSVLDELEAGKTVKLYAHNMNEYEKELYNELVERGEL